MHQMHIKNHKVPEVTDYLPSSDVISNLYARKGVVRTYISAGNAGAKKGFYYDILVIDDRSPLFRLRHTVVTLYHGTRAVGFCDMTSPHLFPDYKISCFGSKNERLWSHSHTINSDTFGIPERELRLGKFNKEQRGFLIEIQLANSPLATALVELNQKIHHHYYQQEKQRRPVTELRAVR